MINTVKHLAFFLKAKPSEITFLIENIDKFYYEKKEAKTKEGYPQIKNGEIQYRTLHPSISKLKFIQKRICSNILSKLIIPGYAFGSIPGKDNIANAKLHLGNKYFFTTDIKSFFPFISNKMVFDMFRSFQFSPTVSRILTRLVTYKGNVPQGAPTSPAIANLTFIKTGIKLQEFAYRHNLTFTTYLDDLTFSSKNDYKADSQFIVATLKEDGYRISHDKTNYRTKNVAVTGILVNRNRLELTETYKQKIKASTGKNSKQQKAYELYGQRVLAANNA